MPVHPSTHGSNQVQRFPLRSSLNGIGQPPSTRPFRQSLFHNPDWPPAPDHAPPTPAIIRAARMQAQAVATNGNAAGALQHGGFPGASFPTKQHDRAEQIQARALAAQAAHQQRFANLAAHRRSLPNCDPAFSCENSLGSQLGGDDVAPISIHSDGLHSFSYPTLDHISSDVTDIIDEIQVDLSLPLVDNSSPLSGEFADESSMQFTSPTATVDISAFMPPPGPPVLVANEFTIAASAVPLTDWAADLCWSLVTRVLSPRLGSAAEHEKWMNALFEGRPRQDALPPTSTNCAALRTFANNILQATLPSPQCLILGLLYISKLPIGNFYRVPPELNSASTPPGVLALFTSLNTPSWTNEEREFRETLYGHGNLYHCVLDNGADPNDLDIAQSVFSLALMLGNKWLEDNTFTTRTWHDVTGLPQARLKAIENAALKIFNFSLAIPSPEWMRWLSVMRTHTSHLIAREAIGMTTTANAIARNRVDELLLATRNIQHDTASSPNLSFQIMAPNQSASDTDEDVILFHPARRHPRPPHVAGHARTASLPVAGGFGMDQRSGKALLEINDSCHRSSFGQGVPYHRPALQQRLGRRIWRDEPEVDPFQLVAPHPALFNPTIEPRKPVYVETGLSETRRYMWDQIQAEMVAREREQEAHISTWPRPMMMDWSGPWVPQAPGSVGV
ncbi:hypothetical protein FRC05_001524 [Tulasnella sp. 425]|nr:hypothetical protein FRC05_001524 [Tulasnella sp. 425]